MKWDEMPVADQRRIQNERLHRYLTEVIAPFSPYYKRFDFSKIKSSACMPSGLPGNSSAMCS